jgi:hypothetical protein
MTTTQLLSRIRAEIFQTIALREALVKAGLCSSALLAHELLAELYKLEHQTNVLHARAALRSAPVPPGPTMQRPACKCLPPTALVVYGD